MTELKISGNDMGKISKYGSLDISGLTALADVIPGMGAMTSLNLASNMLGVKGAKIIAVCIPKCT